MLKSPAHRSLSSVTTQIQQILQSPLMSVIYLISAILCLFSGRGFLALMLFASCVYSNPVFIWKIQHQYRDIFQRYKLNVVMFTGVVFGLFAGVVLGLAFVEPSHAQFFNNAQTFIQTNFKGTGANVTQAVSLVMNTLRMLFVMYVLFGIVQVFQAVRQGEEWKDLAKTPFFVVLAGTLGDVLVGAITGTSSTPTP
jgi:ABC-type multidrug transport system fused ATPase/permease subunit